MLGTFENITTDFVLNFSLFETKLIFLSPPPILSPEEQLDTQR